MLTGFHIFPTTTVAITAITVTTSKHILCEHSNHGPRLLVLCAHSLHLQCALPALLVHDPSFMMLGHFVYPQSIEFCGLCIYGGILRVLSCDPGNEEWLQ